MTYHTAHQFLQIMAANWHLADLSKLPETDRLILNDIVVKQQEDERQADFARLKKLL